MRWPWTRSEEELRKEQKQTDDARHHLKDEVERLDRILDQIELRLKEGVADAKPN